MNKQMILEVENQKLKESQAVMASFLVSLLREKHSGRAFVSMSTLAEVQSQPWGIRPVPHNELGNVSLTVVGPDGMDAVQGDAQPPEMEIGCICGGLLPHPDCEKHKGRTQFETLQERADRMALVENPIPNAPDEEVTQEIEPPAVPCEDGWHQDPDRMGLLCPKCGCR